MLPNFHMCGIMLLLRAVLNIIVRNASLVCQYHVSCFFALFYCLLDMALVGIMLYPCIHLPPPTMGA